MQYADADTGTVSSTQICIGLFMRKLFPNI